VEALAVALCEEYEVSEEQARIDVAAIVGEWLKVNLLE
jgi:hypothetical protein